MASAREVLGEETDGGGSGPNLGGGVWGGESWSSSDGWSEDEWLEDGEEWSRLCEWSDGGECCG